MILALIITKTANIQNSNALPAIFFSMAVFNSFDLPAGARNFGARQKIVRRRADGLSKIAAEKKNDRRRCQFKHQSRRLVEKIFNKFLYHCDFVTIWLCAGRGRNQTG